MVRAAEAAATVKAGDQMDENAPKAEISIAACTSSLDEQQRLAAALIIQDAVRSARTPPDSVERSAIASSDRSSAVFRFASASADELVPHAEDMEGSWFEAQTRVKKLEKGLGIAPGKALVNDDGVHSSSLPLSGKVDADRVRADELEPRLACDMQRDAAALKVQSAQRANIANAANMPATQAVTESTVVAASLMDAMGEGSAVHARTAEEEHAAVKVQAALRRMDAKAKASELRKAMAGEAVRQTALPLAAAIVQARARGVQSRRAMQRLRRERREREDATLKLQSFARGRAERLAAREQLEARQARAAEQALAAGKLQALQRSRKARQLVAAKRNARAEREAHAVVLMQSRQRARMARRIVSEEHKQTAAATKLAAVHRGVTARRKARAFSKQQASATRLQVRSQLLILARLSRDTWLHLIDHAE